jgi:hypothetical protein
MDKCIIHSEREWAKSSVIWEPSSREQNEQGRIINVLPHADDSLNFLEANCEMARLVIENIRVYFM